jgi:glutamine synthetase adenylyltransferase
VEGLAPKKFVDWDIKRSAGGRYDVEYILAVGMAATGTNRVDYFTMDTRERIDALVGTEFLSAEEGATLHGAVDLFTRVEHFLELEEMTHPGNDEKANWLESHVSRLVGTSGTEALSVAKAAVRACYARVMGG